MTQQELLAMVDHTVLTQTAGWEEIKELCDDAVRYGTASVCIPPSYVACARDYLDGRIPVCTVVGFPNGYMTTAAKVFETEDAVDNGAEEIDMVVNLGWVKDGLYDKIEEEIRCIKEACHGKLLKVIIETCLLTDEEKVELCHVVTRAGADFIKTSTGFSTAGATVQDIKLFAENVGQGIKIKAAGGISSFEDAQKMAELGADRLGTSRLVRIVKEKN